MENVTDSIRTIIQDAVAAGVREALKISEITNRRLFTAEEAGVYLVVSEDRRHIFVTGHSEYDPCTLRDEYVRDVAKNLPIAIPANYFPEDDPERAPLVRWRGHAHLLYANWLNYYVYQQTPYDLSKLLR